jgi:hypothetical protein
MIATTIMIFAQFVFGIRELVVELRSIGSMRSTGRNKVVNEKCRSESRVRS